MHKFKVKCPECKTGASTDQRLLSIFCKCGGTGYIEISLADAILKYENLDTLEIIDEKPKPIHHNTWAFYSSFMKHLEQAQTRTFTFNVPVQDSISDLNMSIWEPAQIYQESNERVRRVQQPGEEYDYARYANEARAERIRRRLGGE